MFNPVFDPVQVEVGFHTPRLADGVDIVVRWADAVGIDPVLARRMAESMLVQPVDWVEAVTGIAESGARWILDLARATS